MKLKEEFKNILEYNVPTVNTSQYVGAWKKEPRGTGMWIFGKKPNVSLVDDIENIDFFHYSGTYNFATQTAIKWAKKMGYGTIYVQS